MRQVGILAVLLAASLVGSYMTWTAPDDDRKATDVLVFQAGENDIATVTWKDDKHTIVLSHPKDANGGYYLVDYTELAEEKTEPPAEGQPAPAPTMKESKQVFVGNAEAETLWKGITPLYALRELTLGADADLAAYGLDAPKATLEVVKGGQTITLDIGGEAFGTKDRYVRANGKIYLLDDKLLRPLQFASTRMVERRLFPTEDKKIEKVLIEAPAGRMTLVQKNADDPSKAFYADAASPDRKHVEGSTWVTKLSRVRLKGYTPEPEIKQPLSPVFKVTVAGGGETWEIEFLRNGEGSGATWYAKSAFNRGIVEVTRTLIEEPADDLASLFDGQDQAEEAEDDAPKDEAAAPPPGAPAAPPAPAAPAPGGAPPAPPPGGSPPAPPH